ncbi:MAG: OmpA family protein [Bacteroidales bacterium]|nr:OmpA family protein [Bacteroidales bacterium]
MKKIWFSVFFISIIFYAFPQNVEFSRIAFPDNKKELRTALSNIKKGDKYYNKNLDYRAALQHYQKAYEFNPNNAGLNYKIFLCYNNFDNKEEGFLYLKKAFSLDSNYNPAINFHIGTMYQYFYSFDTAIYYYEHSGPSMKTKSNVHINECYLGKKMIENEIRCFIDNLGSKINSDADEYNPVLTADGNTLYFTSRRGGKNIDYAPDGKYYENIYMSTKDENGQWQQAVLVEELCTKTHDAVQGISNDGQKIIIYRNDNNGDLFEAFKKGNKFTKPKSIKAINEESSHETSASYSFDQNTIYFCSDRSNSIGKHDIYTVSKNRRGKWDKSKVSNLGNVINTREDERSVFAHPDGKTIYFSSKGHEGMGGFDIYYSKLENGKWSKPVNLGYPVNTPGDDVYFVMSTDGKQGYYASDQAGGFGGRDIYMITFLGPEKRFDYKTEDNLLANAIKPFLDNKSIKSIEVEAPKLTLLKGTVIDEDTKKPLHAIVDLYDLKENELLATFETNEETGRFLLSLPSGKNYSVNINKVGYLFFSQNFDLPDTASYQEIEQTLELIKIQVGKEIVLNNIFFEFNKATLLPESMSELDNVYKLLVDNPDIKVEISGHTDNVGSAAYNKKLSQERANSVVNYLIKKGIKNERLIAVGYGFDKPIAPNTTEEGRQKNRRTEFKVIE